MMDYQNGKFLCLCDDCGKECVSSEDSTSFFNSDLCAEHEAIMLADRADFNETMALDSQA
jgi:hypothetical protein